MTQKQRTAVGVVAAAVAVAVAAAIAARSRSEPACEPGEFLEAVRVRVPAGEVAEGLGRAMELDPGAAVERVASALGSGQRVSAQDTVPFALWCAAHELGSFESALWRTVSGFGDSDTTCAIAGGVVASYLGAGAIPAEWRRAREPLPTWAGEADA